TFAGDTLDVVPLTTLQQVQKSARIVLARSKQIEVREGTGGNIFTYTTFQVVETLKGPAAGHEITLRLLGGRIGNVEVSSPVNLTFTVGDRFVLFLGRDNADGYPTIMPQAIYAVRTFNGAAVIEPRPAGLPLFHAQGGSAYSPAATHVALDDFLFSLKKAAR